MKITLNGKKLALQASTVAGMVEELSLNARQVAVEVNGCIVPRSTYPQALIEEDDIIEIVTFVGGG